MPLRSERTSQRRYSSVPVPLLRRSIPLYTTEQFPVTPYTKFLLSHMPNLQGLRVLDYGCGSGAIAIAANLASAASVLACDISLDALDIVRANALRMDCQQVEVALVGPRTAKVLEGRQFDVILSNPASLPSIARGDPFWSGGRYGTDMIFQLIRIARQHLDRRGYLLFVHTSLASLHRSLGALAAANLSATIVSKSDVPFRTHYDALLPHFLHLRNRGEIYFDSADGKLFEVLYLVQAKHFSEDLK